MVTRNDTTTDDPGPRPTLVYDDASPLLKRRSRWWRSVIGEAVSVVAAPDYARDHAGFGFELDELREERVRLAVPGEPVLTGAAAVAHARAAAPGERWRAHMWRFVPPVRWFAHAKFAVERRFDRQLATAGAWLQGQPEQPRYELTRWLYLRILAVVVLAAFGSLWMQLDGLIGSGGIDPIADAMQRTAGSSDTPRLQLFAEALSVLWWRADDAFLKMVCGSGLVAGLLLLVNVLPGLAVATALVAYMSLTATSVFFGYQWDALLLEVLFLTLFIVPWHPVPGRYREPPTRLGVFALRVLLFRLMFASGVVKLASGDPTWAEWTAMTVHYETQPLPHGWSRFFHHLPTWLHTASVGATFFVELAIPWLYFGPRRARIVASLATIALMLVMAASGNYGFFHLLTIALAVLVLDDDAMPHFIGGSIARPKTARRGAILWTLQRVPAALALALALLGLTQLDRQLRSSAEPPEAVLGPLAEPIRETRAHLHRMRVMNRYGLFARMTTSRPEIIIEVSQDGSNWQALAFQYKPTFMDTAPRFAGLHMPRLDWQLWFAALAGRCDRTRADWYPRFVQRLLEGNEAVWALTGTAPEGTPRQIRARLYDYRFSPAGDEMIWVRDNERGFCPPVMNLGGELRPVR